MFRKAYAFLLSIAVAAGALMWVSVPPTALAADADTQVARPADPLGADTQAEEAERKRRVEARTERAKRDAEFNQLDQDGDGYLTKAELAEKEDLAPGPDALDRDRDGRVSRTEFAAVESSSVGPEE